MNKKKTEENEQLTENEKQEGMRYEEAGIDERILRAVGELGFEFMTPIQEQAIPVFMVPSVSRWMCWMRKGLLMITVLVSAHSAVRQVL